MRDSANRGSMAFLAFSLSTVALTWSLSLTSQDDVDDDNQASISLTASALASWCKRAALATQDWCNREPVCLAKDIAAS